MRPGSPASAFYLLLFLAFFLVGLVLVLLGFDLDTVDAWLEADSDWIEFVANWLFRLACAAVLALCACMVLGGLWQRFVSPRRNLGDAANFEAAPVPAEDGAGVAGPEQDDQPPGWGCMLLALIVGYFAWFGVIG